MTVTETKERIEREFMQNYYEWLKDVNEMPDRDFTDKYTIGKSQEEKGGLKDNQKAVICFQRRFGEKRLTTYERNGYDSDDLLELSRQGFLTHKYYWGRQARSYGYAGVWFIISQKVAKQIYKEYKEKNL